ncbi:serine/threonine protein kinase, partial [Agitococcus lubricus]
MMAEQIPLLPTRYQLQDQLSSGQSALVFKVWDKENEQFVLAKIFSNDHQRAYRREAAAALALKHRHIISCLDTFYLTTGEACLIYDFLQDGTLGHFIKQNKLAKKDILNILENILSGLSCLHKHGFVHCDLKPENILLRISAEHQMIEAIIADLGSATPIKEARSGKQSMGSPAYTAPERLYEGFSTSSDLYSVGIIAFQLITGHLPFIGDVQEVYRAHLSRQPAIHEIKDKELQAFIALLLEKDSHQRIASSEEAIHILQRLYQPIINQHSIEMSDNNHVKTHQTLLNIDTLAIRPKQKWEVKQLPNSILLSGTNLCLGMVYHDYMCNGLIEQDTLIGSIYTASRGVYESNEVNEKA